MSYAQFVDRTRDSMDINYGFESELNYDSKMTGLPAYNVRFSMDAWPVVSNLDYCDTGANISDCFGCVGLRQKQYCILNKQYTKDEYEKLKQKLIEHMKETGELGEFFPIEYSAFAYNESTAMIFFPMTKEDVVANGWRWKDDMPGTRGKETRTGIPDSIHDTPDDIINDMLACETCGKITKLQNKSTHFINNAVSQFHEHVLIVALQVALHSATTLSCITASACATNRNTIILADVRQSLKPPMPPTDLSRYTASNVIKKRLYDTMQTMRRAI